MLCKSEYEAVIGLEVHVELKTESKLFCSCATTFGAPPNTLCCPVCLGYPGALPTWNQQAIALAAKAGLALHATVHSVSCADRKQYFYPDLPKAYQISQNEHPICTDGYLDLSVNGAEKRVRIVRIHLEEDAGKLIHQDGKTHIDGNRCGIPLIEIVSAPELHSGAEVSAYLKALRSVLIAAGISDCKLQEGSMRCDVNVSVRLRGSTDYGVRTELKNLNSFSFAEKAIAFETERQIRILQDGGTVRAETRRFDADRGETVLMRRKERSEDYRFLSEPNLPPIVISEPMLDLWKKELPELPEERKRRFLSQFELSEQDAAFLCNEPQLAEYFETAAVLTRYPTLLSHLLLSELLRYCTEEPFFSPVSAESMAELTDLLGEGCINSTTAKQLLGRLVRSEFPIRETVLREELYQIREESAIREWIGEVIAENSSAVSDYRGGKLRALRALQGKLMAKSRGRADPVLAERLLLSVLKEEC